MGRAARVALREKRVEMKGTAECVGTGEQTDVLRSLECDKVQRFSFSRSLRVSALAEFYQSTSGAGLSSRDSSPLVRRTLA